MTKSIPENTAIATDESNQKAKPLPVNAAREKTIPFRCTVCGKLIACYYPETIPGVIYATCRNGHKIKIRKDDFLREAV